MRRERGGGCLRALPPTSVRVLSCHLVLEVQGVGAHGRECPSARGVERSRSKGCEGWRAGKVGPTSEVAGPKGKGKSSGRGCQRESVLQVRQGLAHPARMSLVPICWRVRRRRLRCPGPACRRGLVGPPLRGHRGQPQDDGFVRAPQQQLERSVVVRSPSPAFLRRPLRRAPGALTSRELQGGRSRVSMRRVGVVYLGLRRVLSGTVRGRVAPSLGSGGRQSRRRLDGGPPKRDATRWVRRCRPGYHSLGGARREGQGVHRSAADDRREQRRMLRRDVIVERGGILAGACEEPCGVDVGQQHICRAPGMAAVGGASGFPGKAGHGAETPYEEVQR